MVDINPIKSNDKAAVVDLHYFCQGAKLQKLRFRECSRRKEMEMFCRLAKNVKLAHKETNYKSFLKYLNGINTGYDNVLLVTGKPFNSDLLNNAPLPMF